MNKEIIDNALSYYGINDDWYRNQCYACMKTIKTDNSLMQKFEELLDVLYVDKTQKINRLWSIESTEELFHQPVHPFVTSVALLYGCQLHQKNMEKHQFDEVQQSIHKTRMKEVLTKDIVQRKLKSIRISQMIWGTYFINVRLVEVGRLQYEYVDMHTIRIHIPSDEKLEVLKVIDSITSSKNVIKRYFKVEKPQYVCDSWLLSPEIHQLVSKDSNIYQFYELFNVSKGYDCIRDIFDFVYRTKECDYRELAEETSLQRVIKEYLLDGNCIHLGCGILKQRQNLCFV